MSLTWSPQQARALDEIRAWLRDPGGPQVYKLWGYAGTGKTELAKEVRSMASGRVPCAAYTGKAASVMRNKGCDGASTIHQLIYLPQHKSELPLAELLERIAQVRTELSSPLLLTEAQANLRRQLLQLEEARDRERLHLAQPAFTLNPTSPLAGASCAIIDECSMVDERIAMDWLSFNVRTLVLGDPAQLPPVQRGCGYFTSGEPDTLLTEVHRQAAESPVLRLATMVREGKSLPLGEYGDGTWVVGHSEVKPTDATGADQVLCGTNATRHEKNRAYRQLMKHGTWYPLPGETLLCLRNNHDLGLLNGTLWEVLECPVPSEDATLLDLVLREADQPDGSKVECAAHALPLLHQEMPRDMPWSDRCVAEEFAWGYVMTVHKSQGSQWDDVLLLDESAVFRADGRRWLYTGLTRAAKRVLVSKRRSIA